MALKLTDFIDWSWWWVTAPLWISMLTMFCWTFYKSYRQQVDREAWKLLKRRRNVTDINAEK